MWIFANDAFISIVKHQEKEGTFLVRARFKEDLHRIKPSNNPPEVQFTPEGDYPFRMEMTQEQILDLVTEEALRIDYTNFKNSVPLKEEWRHDAYLDVWMAMRKHQDKRLPRSAPKKGRKKL